MVCFYRRQGPMFTHLWEKAYKRDKQHLRLITTVGGLVISVANGCVLLKISNCRSREHVPWLCLVFLDISIFVDEPV